MKFSQNSIQLNKAYKVKITVLFSAFLATDQTSSEPKRSFFFGFFFFLRNKPLTSFPGSED